MVISEDILLEHGATVQHFLSNEYVFIEGSASKYYYQIQKGIIKLNNISEEGKEFIHGFPYEGHCFGEFYLLTDKLYAYNAVAVTDSSVIKLSKDHYLKLIQSNPQHFFDVSAYTSERLHFRCVVSSFLAIPNPIIRIRKLLNHVKSHFGYTEKFSFSVPFTRYELSCLIGMRVETVIRAIKTMEETGEIKIDHGKIIY